MIWWGPLIPQSWLSGKGMPKQDEDVSFTIYNYKSFCTSVIVGGWVIVIVVVAVVLVIVVVVVVMFERLVMLPQPYIHHASPRFCRLLWPPVFWIPQVSMTTTLTSPKALYGRILQVWRKLPIREETGRHHRWIWKMWKQSYSDSITIYIEYSACLSLGLQNGWPCPSWK